jgi:hypothetical protein
MLKVNPTPQQSADIFQKNTSVRSLSSWHSQSNRRAEATVAVHSDAASEAEPSSVPPSSSFYISNTGTDTPVKTSQLQGLALKI